MNVGLAAILKHYRDALKRRRPMLLGAGDRKSMLRLEPPGPILVNAGGTVRIVAETGPIPENERAWNADPTASTSESNLAKWRGTPFACPAICALSPVKASGPPAVALTQPSKA